MSEGRANPIASGQDSGPAGGAVDEAAESGPPNASQARQVGPQRARPIRREPKVEVARDALDERGAALSTLVRELLAGEVELGVEVDEVSLRVLPDSVAAICSRLKAEPGLRFDYLRSLSVVDYVVRLEVNYHLFSYPRRHKLVVKTDVCPDSPSLPSVTGIWRAADWFERECQDLFGVRFRGHPDPAPLLLYEGFEGHPGRKSYPFHDYDEW